VQSGECERPIVFERDAIRLFAAATTLDPLVEAVGGHETPARLVRLGEAPLLTNRLRAGVDEVEPLFGPRRREPPCHLDGSVWVAGRNHRQLLSRCTVVARFVFRVERGTESRLEFVDRREKRIAATH